MVDGTGRNDEACDLAVAGVAKVVISGEATCEIVCKRVGEYVKVAVAVGPGGRDGEELGRARVVDHARSSVEERITFAFDTVVKRAIPGG